MPSSLVEAILGTADTGITGDEFVTKLPHKDEVINHGNGVVQEFEDGNEHWYKDGQRHRDGDLPASIYADGGQYWYKNGKRHRDNDQPAVVYDTYQAWYQNDRYHRDGDKPAIIYADGEQRWFKNGVRHRDGGKPAVVRPDGTVEYWVNGRPDASS